MGGVAGGGCRWSSRRSGPAFTSRVARILVVEVGFTSSEVSRGFWCFRPAVRGLWIRDRPSGRGLCWPYELVSPFRPLNESSCPSVDSPGIRSVAVASHSPITSFQCDF